MISPLANVSPKAQLGKNVIVSPFATIEDKVIIGDNTWIGPNAVIMNYTKIGNNCKIFPGAVIGAEPQDLKFKGEESTVEIGNNTTIREFVTIHRGTLDKMTTKVGDNCLIMAYVHLAHDCIIGNNVILANGVQLSGHILVEDYAIIEGMSAAQQFITVGKHAFVAGASLIRKSVPPYVRCAREPLQYIGVNTVGLTRRGFTPEQIRHLEDIYRIIYVKGYNLQNALEIVEKEIPDSPFKREIIEFIKNQKDGVIRGN
ncbi:MAG: acyl-ACP--UDP-N-acetylglucosamine O-acyltransferase [Bacteroidia bacterium]|nr:acyl-ACP--UDP-N-acetylglucosamine O-acyltransferase [Bacteroidia bacterium]